jgi:hypothetical protein
MSLTHDSFRWNNEIKVWPNDSKYKFKFDQRINLEIWMVLLRLPSKNKKKTMGKADLADHELMLNDQCDQQKYIPTEVILLIFCH